MGGYKAHSMVLSAEMDQSLWPVGRVTTSACDKVERKSRESKVVKVEGEALEAAEERMLDCGERADGKVAGGETRRAGEGEETRVCCGALLVAEPSLVGVVYDEKKTADEEGWRRAGGRGEAAARPPCRMRPGWALNGRRGPLLCSLQHTNSRVCSCFCFLLLRRLTKAPTAREPTPSPRLRRRTARVTSPRHQLFIRRVPHRPFSSCKPQLPPVCALPPFLATHRRGGHRRSPCRYDLLAHRAAGLVLWSLSIWVPLTAAVEVVLHPCLPWRCGTTTRRRGGMLMSRWRRQGRSGSRVRRTVMGGVVRMRRIGMQTGRGSM